jgi:hypothetical protein
MPSGTPQISDFPDDPPAAATVGAFTYVNFVLVPSAAVARPNAARLRLFHFPAFGRHDAVRGPGRSSLRNTIDPMGLTGAGRRRLAAASAASSCCGFARHGSRRRGHFFAQATATGFVSRAATADRGAASGIYLASYFAGGNRRHCDPRPHLRSDRLASLCRRHRARTRDRGGSRDTFEDASLTLITFSARSVSQHIASSTAEFAGLILSLKLAQLYRSTRVEPA